MASSSAGPAAICGNSVIEPGEGCEDENTTDGDGCTGCQQDTGWTCSGLPSVCVTTCGDGIRAGMEECDDHNTMTDDGCDPECRQQYLDEIEPNEDQFQALANGPIRPGFIYRSHLEHTHSQPDVWLMRITSPTQIRLQIGDLPDLDTCGPYDIAVYIYESSGSWVAGESDNGPGLCADLNAINAWTHQVAPGDYVLHVHSPRVMQPIPDYFLKLTYLSVCGDGVKQQYEQCDGSPDCDASCRWIADCGNGRREDGEQCDNAMLMTQGACTSGCMITLDHHCLTPTFCQPAETRCNNGVDDDQDGNTDSADGDCVAFGDGSGCAAGQTQFVFTSNDMPRPIKDLATTETRMQVPPGFGVVRRVGTRFTLRHGEPDQLDIFLRAPAGQVVELTTDNGMGGIHGYLGTVLDDACPSSVTTSSDPFSGCFAPEGRLGDLAGIDSAGDWALVVTDDTSIDPGDLSSWTLMMCTE